MSMHDRAAVALLAHLAMAADGALLGVGVAYVTYRTIRKYCATSSALRKIRQAPSVQPSDLRSILPRDNDSDDGNACSSDLVIVRGTVDVKSAVEKGDWKSLRDSTLVSSKEPGEIGVILQETHTCQYSEWRNVFGWTADLHSMLLRTLKESEVSSTRMVPFILVEEGKGRQSDYVVVNMEGSNHQLPLTTVHRDFQPIKASLYTLLQALFDHEFPVALLYEEKILPLGKDITAIGICNIKDGVPEIKSCKDLPYFLSELTKDEILMSLSFKTKVLMWSGFVFGSLALGILGYSISRNWIRWKEWRRRRQSEQQEDNPANNHAPPEVAEDEEPVPDGQLCVICLTRRKRSAFNPCGHLVCCQRCALSVEREVSPKCPVCRQPIRGSLSIYDC